MKWLTRVLSFDQARKSIAGTPAIHTEGRSQKSAERTLEQEQPERAVRA